MFARSDKAADRDWEDEDHACEFWKLKERLFSTLEEYTAAQANDNGPQAPF